MSQPSSTPTDPVCAALAPLLPLVAHDLLASVMGAEQAAEARAHLATCAHCQHELDLHARVDGALRQAFAVRADAAPPLAHEQLAALIASDAPAAVERPSPARVRMPRRPRRAVLAGLPAAAAVLLIALFAGYLFRSGGHGDPARPTPTVAPAFNLPAGTRLTSIAPVSSDEWWAAGAVWHAAGAGTPTRNQDTPGTVAPVIVHALAGHLSLAALPPLPFQGAYGVALTGIAMDSPTDGWAIGNTVLPPNADGWTLSVLLHYTGGAWIQVHAPMSGRLDAIAMRTANDGWMAGQDNSGQTQVFHYDGASWTQVHDPALAHLILHSIATPAPNDVWMVGYQLNNGAGQDTPDNGAIVNTFSAIVHYDGTHWTAQFGPVATAQITDITMVSPTMGWAVANGPAEQYSGANTVGGVVDVEYLIAYHDGVWEQRTAFIHPRQEPAFDLLGLAMRSASDGWAVGSQGTLIHYGGGQWRQVHGPTTRDLYAVTQVGAADGWAVGDGAILHLTGGRWSVAALSAAG